MNVLKPYTMLDPLQSLRKDNATQSRGRGKSASEVPMNEVHLGFS